MVKYMEISSRFLKVSSMVEVPDDMEFQKDYEIKLTGTVVKKEYFDENNGTFKEVLKFKPLTIEIE